MKLPIPAHPMPHSTHRSLLYLLAKELRGLPLRLALKAWLLLLRDGKIKTGDRKGAEKGAWSALRGPGSLNVRHIPRRRRAACRVEAPQRQLLFETGSLRIQLFLLWHSLGEGSGEASQTPSPKPTAPTLPEGCRASTEGRGHTLALGTLLPDWVSHCRVLQPQAFLRRTNRRI